MKKILSLVFVLCCMQALAQTSYKTVENVPYRQDGDAYARERCVLDIYYPEGLDDFATVVWFHGGGIIEGQKEIPSELKDSRLAVVAANYRLLPKVDVRETVDDAAAAVAWVFAHIAEYGGSPDKIFVSGHSAGGYLTDMIVLDKHYLEKYGVDADRIAGAFPFSAQVVTHYNVRKESGIGPLDPVIDDTAPLFHMRKLPMPLFVLSGDRELELYGRYEEQAYFWRMMKLHGNDQVYLYEFDGYDHGTMPDPAFNVMKRQIRTILSGRPIRR